MESAGVTLALEDAGEGIPVVLLHGLTATRRYVVMGSKALERSGHRVAAYDARGHGRSSPAPSRDDYAYPTLAEDLGAVLDSLELDRAVLAGASMGAHTIARLALAQPERVAAAVLITPGPRSRHRRRCRQPGPLGRARAPGCARAGWRGSSTPTAIPDVPEAWQDDRRHRPAPAPVRARASGGGRRRAARRCRARSPFEALGRPRRDRRAGGRRRQPRRGRPRPPARRGGALGAELPDARLVVEEPGKSPLAWQGGQLSKVIAELASEAGRTGRLG